MRIHRLLDHESPDSESSIEKLLREELSQATNDLESAKEVLMGAQQSLSTTLAEARDLRRQMKLLQPRVECARRERDMLADSDHIAELSGVVR